MKKNRKKRRKRALLRLQHVLTGAVVICVTVIALLLAYSFRDNEISGSGSDAGSALLTSGGNIFAAAGEEAARTVVPAASGNATEKQGKNGRANEADGEDADAQSNKEEYHSPEELAAESDVPRIRIVLDPGHDGPGTTDERELGAKYRGTFEKYLTLKIAQAAGVELSTYGNVEVLYTRESDKALTLKERAAYAKSAGADYLISLHLNASEEHNFFGIEVFASAFGSYYAWGKGIGDALLNQLMADGFASKGVKTRLGSKGADYYGIIRECRAA